MNFYTAKHLPARSFAATGAGNQPGKQHPSNFERMHSGMEAPAPARSRDARRSSPCRNRITRARMRRTRKAAGLGRVGRWENKFIPPSPGRRAAQLAAQTPTELGVQISRT